MPLTFYKGSPSMKGCGIGFSFNSKDGAIYVSLVQQSSWDANRKLGSFAGAKTNLKFNISEAGAIIDAFQYNKTINFFHKNPSNTSSIMFNPYMAANKETGEMEHRGYGMKVTQKTGEKSVSWMLTITCGEGMVIIEWLKFALNHCFAAIYSADKKKFSGNEKEKLAQEERQEDPTADDGEVEL